MPASIRDKLAALGCDLDGADTDSDGDNSEGQGAAADPLSSGWYRSKGGGARPSSSKRRVKRAAVPSGAAAAVPARRSTAAVSAVAVGRSSRRRTPVRTDSLCDLWEDEAVESAWDTAVVPAAAATATRGADMRGSGRGEQGEVPRVWESDDDDGGGGGGVQDGAAAEAAVEGLGAWGGGAGASSDEGGHQGRCRARTAVASSAGAVGSAGTRARGGDRARAGEGGVAGFVYQPGSLTVDPNQAEYPQLVEPPFTSEKADIVLAPSETAAEHNAKATRGAQWSTETLVCPAAIAQYLRDYQKEGVRWLHAQYRLRTHATSTKP
jgi:hypothetical protein